MPNLNITADNLPKDSGNRYAWAPFDPVASAYSLPLANPLSGSFGGLAMGHMHHNVIDVMTATSTISSGVDLMGWTQRGLIQPLMGSGAWLVFQVSASAQSWTTVSNQFNSGLSATAAHTGQYAMDQTVIQHTLPYRWVRISATVLQTATRNFTWVLNS